MESQNAGTESQSLSFDNEDMGDIENEDTSQSTTDEVTVLHVIPSCSDQEKKDVGLLEVSNLNREAGRAEGISSHEEVKLDSTVIRDNVLDYGTDKIQEVNSHRDASSNLLGTKDKGGGPDQTEECITYSLSFALKPEVHSEEPVNKEVESQAEGDSGMTESQALSPSREGTPKLKSKGKKVKKATNKDGRDSDSSVSSKKKGKSNKTKIKSKFAPGSFEYIEERLRGLIFSGWIEERKWVDTLSGYRDIIEVDEWEVEMNQTLMSVIRSVPGVLDGSKWINITSPSAIEPCYCVWTLLTSPPTPGHYWFSVSGIALHPQFGLRVMLKIIRSIHPHDGEAANIRRKRRKELAKRDPGNELETLSEQVLEWVQQVRQISLSNVWSAVSSTLTISNIRESIRFVVVLSMTLVVGFIAFVRESHHYVIQFIHAAGVFFRNITPFMQSLLAFVEKIIGGMYLLIAMVYRDFRQSSAKPPPQMSVARPPMAIADRQGFSPTQPVQRTVKYVPPEQWVFKSHSASPSDK